jgi:hypothetical protein
MVSLVDLAESGLRLRLISPNRRSQQASQQRGTQIASRSTAGVSSPLPVPVVHYRIARRDLYTGVKGSRAAERRLDRTASLWGICSSTTSRKDEI